jgi:hypothetical protein
MRGCAPFLRALGVSQILVLRKCARARRNAAKISGDGSRLVNMRGGRDNLDSVIRSAWVGGNMPNIGPCFYCNDPHGQFECPLLRRMKAQGSIDANGHPDEEPTLEEHGFEIHKCLTMGYTFKQVIKMCEDGLNLLDLSDNGLAVSLLLLLLLLTLVPCDTLVQVCHTARALSSFETEMRCAAKAL